MLILLTYVKSHDKNEDIKEMILADIRGLIH